MGILIRKPSEKEIKEMMKWPIWECEPSEFPWTYVGTETCYLLEGKVTITTDEEEVEFGAGESVIFPDGLSCRWRVKEKVRKHFYENEKQVILFVSGFLILKHLPNRVVAHPSIGATLCT